MSLESPYVESYYAADGVTTVFPVGFTKISDNYVKCIIYFEDGTNCVPTFIVNANDIKIVTLTKPDGTVLTVPPAGSTVRVFRDVPEDQDLTASQIQDFTAKQLEKAFDAIVGMIQENTYTTEHKTVRLTETQRDVYLAMLTELVDGSLLYWDDTTRTIKPTEYPQTDVVRCIGGLFFRVVTRGLVSYLEWSINREDWHSLDFDKLNDFMNTAGIEINDLKQRVSLNTMSIDAEKIARRQGDEDLRQLILNTTYDVSQFDDRISQNTTDISGLLSRLDRTVTASDKAMPKSYIDSLVSGIYHIKGVKATVDDLPTEGNVTGDCWNVLADGNTYIWTEDEEWVSGGAAVDFSPYRKAVDQDIIDAGKQDKLTIGTNIEITANNTINMTGKFGKTIASSGKNLTLKDQDGVTLSETILSIGVDAEYDSDEEDIEFEEGEAGDYAFIQEQLNAINAKIPDEASSSNKLATTSEIGRADLTIQKNGTVLGTFNANASTAKTINVTVPTRASEVHALPDTTKYAASLEFSINPDTYVITAQLQDQYGNHIGSAKSVDLPLESVVVSGSYDAENKKIVLTLKNGSTIDIPVGDLIAGLQTEITPTNKLSSDLVDDTNATHKFVTEQDMTSWNNKVTKTTDASKVYGTDSTGAQTTYDVSSFGATPTFATIEGSPYDNTNLATELNKKITQDDSLTLFPVGEEEEHVGEIRQYIGPDYPSNNKFHGYFYQWTKTQLGPSSYSYGWEQWNVQPAGAGAGSIATLSDVQLTTLSDGQALIYDADSGKWVNGNGGVSATYNAETKTITFA